MTGRVEARRSARGKVRRGKVWRMVRIVMRIVRRWVAQRGAQRGAQRRMRIVGRTTTVGRVAS